MMMLTVLSLSTYKDIDINSPKWGCQDKEKVNKSTLDIIYVYIHLLSVFHVRNYAEGFIYMITLYLSQCSDEVDIIITLSLHKPGDWGIQWLDNMTRVKQIGCVQSRNLNTDFLDSRDSNHEAPLHSLSMRCYWALWEGKEYLSNNWREGLVFSLL